MIRLIVLAYLSLLLLGLSDNMRGPLYPEILNEFHLTDALGSWFFSLSSIVGFVGGIWTSFWIRRWGRVRTLQLSIIVCAVGQIGIACSRNFSELLISVLFFGWSMATMGVSQNLIVVTEAPEASRNRLLSGLHSMYALASLLAPLMVHFLSTHGAHSVWRESFLWGAVFSILVLLLSFRLGKESTESAVPQKDQVPRGPFSKQIYFGLMVSSYVLAEILVSSRISQYVRAQFSYDLEASSLMAAGFFVSLLAGRLLFSFWSPRWSLERQLAGSLLLAMGSLLLGILWHPVFLACAGFLMGPFYPLMMVEAGKIFRDHLDQALSVCVGLSAAFVVAMHISFGWINDHFGISTSFYLAPLFCLISFAMLSFREKVFR